MAALAVGLAAGAAYVACVLCCKSCSYCEERKRKGDREVCCWHWFSFLVIILVLFAVNVYMQWKIKKKEQILSHTSYNMRYSGFTYIASQQQDDIFNISSRVQGQEHHQWPTHDAYLSIEHINVANQLNKPNYNDAPPSYEEAMRIAEANSSGSSTVPVVVVVPKTTD